MSQAALERACAILGDRVIATHAHRGDETLIIEGPKVRDVLQVLRDNSNLSFDYLVDLTAMDYLGYPEDTAAEHPGGLPPARMEMVYHLRSSKHGHRLRVRARLQMPDDGSLPMVESLVPLWPGANWPEREAYDLLGVRFIDHPDLRRILMYPEFVGHPLRKDYPKDRRQPLARRDPDPVMQGEG